MHISYPRANELLNRKRILTPDTALRLSSYLGTSAEFWINWQGLYDLQQTIKQHEDEYRRIEPIV